MQDDHKGMQHYPKGMQNDKKRIQNYYKGMQNDHKETRITWEMLNDPKGKQIDLK